MTRKEHLLTILAEECSEIAHRVSKALRFGTDEVQCGQELSNADRIIHELCDLEAVYILLVAEKVLPQLDYSKRCDLLALKKDKIETFLSLSKRCGTLQ